MTYRSHPAPRYAGVGPITTARLITSQRDGPSKPERHTNRRHQTVETNWPARPVTNAAAKRFLD